MSRRVEVARGDERRERVVRASSRGDEDLPVLLTARIGDGRVPGATLSSSVQSAGNLATSTNASSVVALRDEPRHRGGGRRNRGRRTSTWLVIGASFETTRRASSARRRARAARNGGWLPSRSPRASGSLSVRRARSVPRTSPRVAADDGVRDAAGIGPWWTKKVSFVPGGVPPFARPGEGRPAAFGREAITAELALALARVTKHSLASSDATSRPAAGGCAPRATLLTARGILPRPTEFGKSAFRRGDDVSRRAVASAVDGRVAGRGRRRNPGGVRERVRGARGGARARAVARPQRTLLELRRARTLPRAGTLPTGRRAKHRVGGRVPLRLDVDGRVWRAKTKVGTNPRDVVAVAGLRSSCLKYSNVRWFAVRVATRSRCRKVDAAGRDGSLRVRPGASHHGDARTRVRGRA